MYPVLEGVPFGEYGIIPFYPVEAEPVAFGAGGAPFHRKAEGVGFYGVWKVFFFL
jgi:hypothetical protein